MTVRSGNEDGTNLRAIDLFPELGDEMDRRIAHSETRIKFWVLSGVIANLLIATAAAVPTIYSLGQIAGDVRGSLENQQSLTVEMAARAKWMQDRMIWEARVEAALRERGFDVAPTRSELGANRR